MREFKFRAWDTEKQEMATVNFIGLNDYEVGMEDEECRRWRATYPYVCRLMQYTGVKDKNGREIYEGDIVEYKNEYHVIEWDDCKFMAKGFYCSSQDTPDDFFSEFAYTNCKVIGNIYENSELLERK